MGHWLPITTTYVGQNPKNNGLRPREGGGMRMMSVLVDRRPILDAPKEILELVDELKLLLIQEKITDEEFALLYGYIYLAREQLMTVEDVRFILSNAVKNG